ncbi:preprotein translocase subunit YajC [Aurantimicrobium minutum]|jgi:preprotein translocase subunit YajC|uniref:preprotein translocase subunit YajC n=1 Tax=Aurantimicrobium minutum TaxID=708131 RepID=UPI00247505D0|nr:preprotein translocase subunit YajC [Aurantimicrobium minutum]MDH6239352.1 preprotein translocase subunit YajC [Aurantimicrobium minutum]
MDPMTLFMMAVLAVLVFFMFRNGQKRKKAAEELQKTVVPGAHVMTTFGVYGTIKSIDDAENIVVLETSPKNTLKLHRQAIARVVENAAVAPTAGESIGADISKLALDPEAEAGALEIDPQFGERKPKNKK